MTHFDPDFTEKRNQLSLLIIATHILPGSETFGSTFGARWISGRKLTISQMFRGLLRRIQAGRL